MVSYHAHDVAAANRTFRSTGVVGPNAIVPRFVASVATPTHTILDFGAGTTAPHTTRLRAAGLHVVAHDFGENVVPGVHDPEALSRTYDIVFGSNVLNVQVSESMLQTTLTQMFSVVAPGGSLVVNYPAAPRKLPLGPADIATRLAPYGLVGRAGGTRAAPLFVVVTYV